MNTSYAQSSPSTSRGELLPLDKKSLGTTKPRNFSAAAYMAGMTEKKENQTKSETNQRDIGLRDAWLAGKAAKAELSDDRVTLRAVQRAMTLRQRTAMNRTIRAGENAYAELRKHYEGLLVSRANSAVHSAANQSRAHLSFGELFAAAEEKFFQIVPKWEPEEATFGYYAKLCIGNALANAVKKLGDESRGDMSGDYSDISDAVRQPGPGTRATIARAATFKTPVPPPEDEIIAAETEARRDVMAALVARMMVELQAQDPTTAAIIRGLEYYEGKKSETAKSLAKKLGLKNGARVAYLKDVAIAELRVAVEAQVA